MRILNGDNLQILKSLEGERFDLAELDGPYMAGLEGWDILTEAEYIQHYAERLTALRPLLQPWGVVFVFGYPEGVAEIKSWAHRTNTLYCRRWLTWYKQVTAHKGRKVENVLMFMLNEPHAGNFGKFLTRYREQKGLTREQLGEMIDGYSTGRIGKGLYEIPHGKYLPPQDKFIKLSYALGFNPSPWWHVVDFAFEGLTNIDYIEKSYQEQTESLNDDGLRSKPVGLYVDLFKPTIPPTEKRKALVLYGGSGNAAIAAEALGYEVTVIEQDPKRCKLIEKRSSRLVQTWREKLSQGSLWGFPTPPAPDGGDSAPSQALSTPDMFSAIEHEPTPAPRR
jgi:transcriptional regulator with XRE-family HTH domain